MRRISVHQGFRTVASAPRIARDELIAAINLSATESYAVTEVLLLNLEIP